MKSCQGPPLQLLAGPVVDMGTVVRNLAHAQTIESAIVLHSWRNRSPEATMKKSTALIIGLVLAACLWTGSLSAAIVSFGFSGTLNSVQNASNVL